MRHYEKRPSHVVRLLPVASKLEILQGNKDSLEEMLRQAFRSRREGRLSEPVDAAPISEALRRVKRQIAQIQVKTSA